MAGQGRGRKKSIPIRAFGGRFGGSTPALNANKPPVMKIHKAAHMADKNSRTIVKIVQLLEVLHQGRAASEDVNIVDVQNVILSRRIEKLKRRLNRRLQKLSKWCDIPAEERLLSIRPPRAFLLKQQQFFTNSRYPVVIPGLPVVSPTPYQPPVHVKGTTGVAKSVVNDRPSVSNVNSNIAENSQHFLSAGIVATGEVAETDGVDDDDTEGSEIEAEDGIDGEEDMEDDMGSESDDLEGEMYPDMDSDDDGMGNEGGGQDDCVGPVSSGQDNSDDDIESLVDEEAA